MAGYNCVKGLKQHETRALEVMRITLKALVFVWGGVWVGFCMLQDVGRKGNAHPLTGNLGNR
jgi:hypothetical protein